MLYLTIIISSVSTVSSGHFPAPGSVTMSPTMTVMLWAGFAISCLMMILTHPLCCAERKSLDEEGKEVLLRRPLVGFKACEVTLDLEGIRKGIYDPEDGHVDQRLHDGYRYGPALLRI